MQVNKKIQPYLILIKSNKIYVLVDLFPLIKLLSLLPIYLGIVGNTLSANTEGKVV